MGRRLTTLALAGLLLAGCAAPAAVSTPADDAGSGSPSATASQTHQTPEWQRPEEDLSRMPEGLGDPVASRTINERAPMRLDVYAPHRGDQGVVLTVRLSYLSGEDFDVSPLSNTSDTTIDSGTGNGLRLLDHQAGKLYLPALDPSGKTLCTPEIPALPKAGDQVFVSCPYATPASDSVTVMAGTFGAFPNLPVR